MNFRSQLSVPSLVNIEETLAEEMPFVPLPQAPVTMPLSPGFSHVQTALRGNAPRQSSLQFAPVED